MSRHRFAVFWATVLVVTGLVLVVIGVALAVAVLEVDLPWPRLTELTRLERILVALAPAAAGLLAGAPLIGLGELLHLSIAQRRLLERQRRRLVRIARRRASASERPELGTAAADRLLRRRR